MTKAKKIELEQMYPDAEITAEPKRERVYL